MAIQIQLNKSQLADLKAIRELGPEVLSAVVDRIDSLQPVPLAPSELQKAILEVIEGNEEAVNSTLRQAISLASLQRRRKLDAETVVIGIRKGLQSASMPWDGTSIAKWEALEPAFRRLISSKNVEVAAKALDLSYDYANLLQTTRIVTDVRPVFDNEVTKIEGAVVSFTLRLSYDNSEGSHNLSLAMNQADIKTLKEQCDRALKKGALARETIATLPFTVTISGSDDYEPR
ncbi:hypothetical protein V5E97_05255 [Singulisphaera sp. Ch08]|uniref:DUF3164 family protein n=1 Tax=Singulisphaera sp. Ch08 TaxID=3120278 RepID=A0AAU7CJX9_9BACT